MKRLTNVPPKHGRMVPFTSSKKNLGIVTSLVTAEREKGLLSFTERVLSLRMRRPFSCQGLRGVSALFVIIFYLISFYFGFTYLY